MCAASGIFWRKGQLIKVKKKEMITKIRKRTNESGKRRGKGKKKRRWIEERWEERRSAWKLLQLLITIISLTHQLLVYGYQIHEFKHIYDNAALNAKFLQSLCPNNYEFRVVEIVLTAPKMKKSKIINSIQIRKTFPCIRKKGTIFLRKEWIISYTKFS